MQCPHCQAPNADNRRFCGECGKPLAILCPSCQFENQPHARFCGGCGASLTVPHRESSSAFEEGAKPARPDAERRQLTVMFCDLVGSTELSRLLDPEDLRELLDRYQAVCAETIQRYGGHIARYVGDGLLVYFGYPTAHEDDPRRAVRAGLDIVSEIPKIELKGAAASRLAVRIGINTGLVVAGDIGSGAQREQMAIVGETPNIAARLQALAEPDGVLVGEPTKRLIDGLFVCEPLGPQQLKGVADPVPVYRVRSETGAPSRFEASALHGLTPLVGREHEIGLLLGRWDHACEGDGQVVLLSGEAGIGKSRIVRGFQERIKDAPRNRVLYFCSPYYQGSAFYPITDQLQRALRFAAEDTLEQKLDKLDGMLSELSLPVEDHGPVLASLLSLPTGSRYPPITLDPQESKRRILKATMAVIEAMAARDPVLVVAEDVHWADSSTLDLLELMMTRAVTLWLLLVVTFRSDFEPPWQAPGHSTAITLNRLSRRETAELVSRVVDDRRLPSSVVDRIVARTDGVPLFVEELTKALAEAGRLAERRGAPEAREAPPVTTIPASLQDSLVARLDHLGPAKEAAQLGATIGRRFDFELLRLVSPLPERELHAALARLVESGLAYRQETLSGTVYEFKHALVRDAAYTTLLKSRRQQYHGQIAETLEHRSPQVAESEPMLLAHHYSEAGLTGEAIRHWLRAGRVFHDRGAIDMSIAAYRKVLDKSEERRIRCQAWIGVAAGMRIIDRFDDAFAALEGAEKEAIAAGLTGDLARIHHLRGNLYFPLGEGEACRAAHARALEYARQAGSPELEAHALGGLGDAEYVRGRMRTAYHSFHECVELCRRHDLAHIEAANLSMVGHTRLYLNELRSAVEDGLASIELARRLGLLRAEINAQLVAIFALYDLGEWEQAKAHIERGLDCIERLGARRFAASCLRYRGRILYAEGRRAEAMETLERAVQYGREISVNFDAPRTLGFLAYATDDPGVRAGALAEAERIIEQGCVGHCVLYFYRDAIDVALKLGDWDEADRYASALEGYTRPEPLPWGDFFIARARALAAHGRGARSADVVRRLEHLRDEAERVGMKTALPAIEQALSG